MLLGSAFIGGFGDQVGRRPMVVISTAGYASLMLVSTLSTTLWQLTAARFAIGICVGALLPNAIVLAGELVHQKQRSRTSAAITLGISLGATMAGVAAAVLLPGHGWRGLFLFGGAVPLLFSLILWAVLPESPEFRQNEPNVASTRPGLSALFRDDLASLTIAIWVMVILLSMTLYLLSSWTPLLLRESGLSTREAAVAGSGYYLGGMTGGEIAALLLGRSGWLTLSAFLVLAAVTVLAASRVQGPALTIGIAIASAGAFVTGSQAAFNGLAASAYPLGLRTRDTALR